MSTFESFFDSQRGRACLGALGGCQKLKQANDSGACRNSAQPLYDAETDLDVQRFEPLAGPPAFLGLPLEPGDQLFQEVIAGPRPHLDARTLSIRLVG